MNLYEELALLRTRAVMGWGGIFGREHTVLVAVETRLRTLEQENRALRLALDAAVNEGVDVGGEHPPTIDHWRGCRECAWGGR